MTIAVGCAVRMKHSGNQDTAKVVAIHGAFAWIEWPHGGMGTVPLKEIETVPVTVWIVLHKGGFYHGAFRTKKEGEDFVRSQVMPADPSPYTVEPFVPAPHAENNHG